MSDKSSTRQRLSEPISIVAHQLKNPISILKFYIEAISSESFGQLNEKQKEYLADSLANVQRMAKMVDYLLEVSKIEANRYVVKPEVFDLAKTIAEIVKSFFYWAEASNCDIVFSCSEELPPVYADKRKIYQVIENIISNAIKYKSAARGRIVIELTQKNGEMLFACKDNGIGISDEDCKKIFSKFYRSEQAFSMDPSGSGLGLYINKAAVEGSGGKIWFERNKDGVGIIVFFTLPIAKAS